MKRRGHNLLAVGDFNEAVILDTIRRASHGVSRVEIARTSGLSAQTVSNVTRRLLEEGLVIEGNQLISGPGKPRTPLHLNPTSRHVIGVHLDPTVVTYVLLNLNGEVLLRSQDSTQSEAGTVIEAMAAEIEGLLQRGGVNRDSLIGIGIAAPGPLDVSDGILIDPPLLEGWEQVPIREALAQVTGKPVVLEKDVTATAIAEVWTTGGPQRENFASFYYGSGIGVGLVVDGDVLRGVSRNAGEIGHMMVQADGPICRCGRRGCAGEVIAPGFLVQEAVRAGVLSSAPESWNDYHANDRLFGELAAAAERGDPRAVAVFEAVVVRFARVVITLVNILDIDHIVFGGPYWPRIEPLVLDAIPAAMRGDLSLVPPHDVILESSRLGEHVAAIGAGCVVLDQALSPRPSSLLIGAGKR